MDGYAVAAALRAERSTATIRLVAISGHGSDTERRRSLDAGFVRHILKPVEPEEVRALVTELVAR
jgi:CheY-like chemotaxis protein